MPSFATWTILLLLVLPGVASAQAACPPLTVVTSVDMRVGADGRAYVPARIADTPRSMLVDTGGFFTELTQAAADELKLSTRHTGLVVIGVSGDTTDVAARAAFTLGSLHAASMDFMIMPSVHRLAPDISDAAGILAPNLLRSYDVEFDFAGRKFNLLSQDHCEGKVLYWPAESVAVVPMVVSAQGHILVTVELDGHRLTALLDTGAASTVLNLETARNVFSLEPGTRDTPARGRLLGSRETTTYIHRFASLSFEGVAVTNLTIDLVPDLMRNKMFSGNSVEHGTRLSDPNREAGLGEMILGMDVLHHLHLYIAYKEKKLYLTPASPAAATEGPKRAPTAH
jgi:predicted aspartyl protease